MLWFNLIASVAIIASFVLGIIGYLGNWQIVLLIIAFFALLIKQVLKLNQPWEREEVFEDEDDYEQWWDSMIDDYYGTIVVIIIVLINLFIVLSEL